MEKRAVNSDVQPPLTMMLAHQTESFSRNHKLFLFASFLLILGVRLAVIDQYSFQIPYWDDWGMGSFLSKSMNPGLILADFFALANEHRYSFNRLLSLLTFNANHQQWDPQIMMIVNSVIWAVTGSFLLSLTKYVPDLTGRLLAIGLLLFLFVFPLALVNIVWGIQTHTYTMIFFAVFGCWFITSSPLSKRWWVGLVCLLSAPLTLAGGSFAAIAVAASHALWAIIDKSRRRQHLTTLVACSAVGVFGLWLILIQPGTPTGVSTSLPDAAVSFLKSISWPATEYIWPALVFFLPVFFMLVQLIKGQLEPTKLIRFVFSLLGFIVLIALAIAYARGNGGIGPARRYYEFLAMFSIASFLCLLLIKKPIARFGASFLSATKIAWLAIFIASIPWLHTTLLFTVENEIALRPAQAKLVNSYLNSKSASVFALEPPSHTPFPSPELLANKLDEMEELDMLPYKLQKPEQLDWHPSQTVQQRKQSAFIRNGAFRPSQNQMFAKYNGETVVGSYRPDHGGARATGFFQSQDFRMSRSFAVIPVLGYLGFKDLTLKLVDVGSNQEFHVLPQEVHSRFAEGWRLILLRLPRGYYRIEATDNNPDLWFAFGSPRSVGRLSYYTQKILARADWVWKIGLLLLLFSCRNLVFEAPKPNKIINSN